MIRLSVTGGLPERRVLESDDRAVRIGRGLHNDLVVDAVHVSTEHARISLSEMGYVLEDLASRNGTQVRRGKDLITISEGATKELLLEPSDELLLGDPDKPVVIAVEIDEPQGTEEIVSVRRIDKWSEATAAAQVHDRELLAKLYTAQKSIASYFELSDVIGAVAEQVFEFVPKATHVTLALRQEKRGRQRRSMRYVPMGTHVRGQEPTAEPIPVTRSVVRKVVKERAAVLAADAARDVGESASLMAAQILSTIGIPLWQGDEILGVLQVDNRGARGVFRESDLDVLAFLAQTASQAVAHARLTHQLRIAVDSSSRENEYLRSREEQRSFRGIVGESPAMKSVFNMLEKVVNTPVTVLIEGETGTGKELVASAVHYWSNRRERLFVAQNCAALPENLLESELFGHKRGAFTGATEDKKGLFELAHEGTLFLDELGEMPLSLQAKLLRVLQEGEVRPVGSGTTRSIDVRIVTATNRDLEAEVKAGRFREDLYYRVRVFPLRLPPLRERRTDVPLLAGHFLKSYAERFGRAVNGFTQRSMELLQAYDWPGNVRELENEVQRLVIQADDSGFVQPDHLSTRVREATGAASRLKPAKGTLKKMMESIEKQLLIEALADHGNNKSQTAKSLGITREGLHKKLKGHGL